MHVDRALRAGFAGDPGVRAQIDGVAGLGLSSSSEWRLAGASGVVEIIGRMGEPLSTAPGSWPSPSVAFTWFMAALIVTTGSARRNHGMIDFSQLDRTIHEKGRLSIMTLLASRGEPWAFQDLKAQLDMSDGNLITHLRTLEKADFISGEKLTGDGRPQTLYTLTSTGRDGLRRLPRRARADSRPR